MPKISQNVLPANAQAVKVAGARDGKQTEWRIRDERGLVLIVSASGTGTYAYRYRVRMPDQSWGQRTLKLGRRDTMELSEARSKVHELRHMVEVQKRDPQDEVRLAAEAKARTSDALTLRGLLDTYLADNDRVSEGTKRQYKGYLTANVLGEADDRTALGNLPAGNITTDQFADVLDAVEVRSKDVCKGVRSALGSIYKWAIHERLLSKNPLHGLGYFHASGVRQRVAEDDELHRLLTGLAGVDGLTDAERCIIRLSVLTGQRAKELVGAEHKELSLDVPNPMWRIPAAKMKHKNRDQILPLSREAAAVFREAVAMSKDSPFVFKARRGTKQMMPSAASRAMATARQSLGVEDLRIHDMRTVVTTWLQERGVSLEVRDLILHHSPKGVTNKHYSFATLEGPVRDAMQMWADHVDAVVKGTGATVVQAKFGR